MVLVILLPLLLESATLIVEAQVQSIQLKTINASCKGKSCINYFVKICPARKGQSTRSLTCLGRYDDGFKWNDIFDLFSIVNSSFSPIQTVDDKVPERFVVFLINLINDQTVVLEEIYNSRYLNGTTLMLKLKDEFVSPASFFCEVELRSNCFNNNCTGFMCKKCYNHRPSVNVTSVNPVVLGSNVTILCYISPFTNDTIVEWIKSNGSFSNIIHTLNNNKYSVRTTVQSHLTIYGTDEDDVGNYICQASNVLQIGQSEPVQLSIFEYPTANISKITPVVEGTNVTIPCSVYPAAEEAYVTWTKNDTIINVNNTEKYGGGILSSPSLEILFVAANDEGNYTCQVTNPVGTGQSQFVYLNVVEDTPRPEIPEIEPIGIGNNATVTCLSYSVSSLSSVTWFKNNVIINDTFTHIKFGEILSDRGFMHIFLAQADDGGNYTCLVQNAAGRTGLSYSSQLKVLEDRPSINISTVPPILAGENVTIHCYISPSSEVTTVIWLKYQNNLTTIIDINDTERFKGGTVTHPSLSIYSVEVEDSGNYTCQAINVVGETLSVPVHLGVYDGPVATTSRINPAIEGGNVTIPCNVSPSSKSTNVTWMKNNNSLNVTGYKYNVGDLPYQFLHIYFVQTDDEGNYTCLASNPVGTGKSKPVHLQVLPDIPIVNLSTLGAISLGINITMSCNISSVSKLTTITWFKNSRTLTFNSHLTIATAKFSGGTLSTQSLKIYFIQKEDEGNYTCKATNAAKHTGSSKLAHLTVSEVTTNIVPSIDQTPTDHTFVTSDLPTPSLDSVSPTISTKKPSIGSSNVDTTATTQTDMPTTTSSKLSSTVKTSTTTKSTIRSASKSTTTSASAKPPSTAKSIVNSENLNAWIITTTVICVVEFIVIVLVVYIMWLRKQRRLAMEYEKEDTAF